MTEQETVAEEPEEEEIEDNEEPEEELDGLVEILDDEGRLEATFTFKQGLKEGPFIGYNVETGQKIAEGSFQEDKLTGTLFLYDEREQIMCEENYQNDQLEGRKLVYFPDQKIAEETMYKNGKPQGMKKLFYPTGEVFEELLYDEEGKGVPIAKPIHYKLNGEILDD